MVSPFTSHNPAVKVSAGDCFSLVLDSQGEVYSCGKGNFGRLGHGDQNSKNEMTAVKYFTENGIVVKDIEAGGRHALVMT